MFLSNSPLTANAPHQEAAFWLDVFDKIIKFGALLVGGVWTWVNFKRSRTYAQKLELQLAGSLFLKRDLFIDVDVVLRNMGASRHIVQPKGTYCEIIAIFTDLSENVIRVIPVFTLHSQVEPGESINDHVVWKIDSPVVDIVWLRINLRIVSGEIEWNATSIVRMEESRPIS